jgi:hypothetical protein
VGANSGADGSELYRFQRFGESNRRLGTVIWPSRDLDDNLAIEKESDE